MSHPAGSMKNRQTVGTGKVVTIQYSLTNSDGVVVREATGRPVTYLHGHSALPARLERSLETHATGDIVRTRLLPEDAFGKRDPDLLYTVPVDEFPPGEQIHPGGQVVGTDETGNQVVFTITGIHAGIAQLDGNHPLAGQTLVFEVEIQGVRDATAGELATGQAEPD
jgi:FKBP-type peptidyl-prolyl cis-trans isomerase SlyD